MALRDDTAFLLEEARDRGLTPQAWWLGRNRHAAALADLDDATHDIQARVEHGRLVELDGLPVKVLSESPERFGLWCREGLLEI